ncbi:leucyl aminopeptidase [Protaetiibacter sp. SSC-01]|uniref:leucyl aminopeptidase n=1 Tax=Protaetiibacter sp. SSC-01 TaxID=2759943 RepID=UPI001656B5D8|nr:leucyl aminopeptidase [Protaetiibacter sp. SSC-01]QNO36450.1 leucyl aminopeptidase [Protaetiibacter sp. SSC-01]
MTAPELSVTSAPLADIEASLLVLGVTKGADGPVLADDVPAEVAELLSPLGVTGAPDEFRRGPVLPGGRSPIAFVGLGAEPGRAAIRSAAGTAGRLASGLESVVLALPVADDETAEVALESAASGAYAYLAYRTGDTSARRPVGSIALRVPDGIDGDALVAGAAATATATHLVRDLVNEPASDLYPETFVERVRQLADGLPVEVEVYEPERLAAEGFGGILGVGSGSSRAPRLVVVRYAPEGAGQHLAVVGKGITYDSGGLSLKPPASMATMKYDMTGAATALATVLDAARRGTPVRVTAWLCLAENMPSGTALRPGDVLRTWSGTTVEVTNTDAEGRVVLADGLAAAAAERPDLLVDVATLTGAARVAMGERTVAVMGDEPAVERVLAAAERADEAMWPMPLPPELRSVLDSDIADLANAKLGHTAGGMLVAGHFLRTFVGESGGEGPGARIGWAHLDIAGPAYNTGGPYGAVGKGPTGVAVRTLIGLTADLAGA